MSKNSFRYLKKGDGTSRFGKIRYPKFSGEKMSAKFLQPSSSSADSGRFTGDSVPETDSNIHRGILDDFQFSSEASFLQWQQHQLEKMDSIETRQFEFIEKLTENMSLNSESSFYQRLIRDDILTSSAGREILKDYTNYYNNNDSPENYLRGNLGGRPPLSEYHRLSTVREVSNENLPESDVFSTKIQNEEILKNTEKEQTNYQKSSSGATSSLSDVASSNFGQIFDRIPQFTLPSFPPPNMMLKLNRNEQETKKDDEKLIEMGKKLESMMVVLKTDAENLELVKSTLEKKEKQLDTDVKKLQTEKIELQNEKRQFDVFVTEEMKKIDKERNLLSKEKNITQKKQNEQISLLRQQILDLQNEMCERESKFSAIRAKNRQLDVELTAVKEENELLRNKIRNLEDTTTKLDKENAQLRCKNWSLKENLHPPPEIDSLKTPKTISKGTVTKTVRFLLPDDAPMFQRTEDRCVQTADVEPLETATEFPSVASRTTCYSVLTDANQQTLERRRPDGSKEIIHPSGTVEEVNPEGRTTLYTYSNGDSRKFEPGGVEIYHFATSNITQIRHPTGLIVIRYKDGREEKYFVDGRVEILTPDRTKRTISAEGCETIQFPNGVLEERKIDGTIVVTFDDGSKETRCSDLTKREFSNGDVKIVYKDGTEETRLTSGRIRIKDAKGKIVKDELINNKESTTR